ncbi:MULTISPECIES: ATP-dependent nuclease [Flavobacteriaceae]|jgi:putative ATP-dependent endonuclease of OLD family|uniref:ATP-dependent nuclease n=1 Tax=Flavobacteriaceae TaxID=49546 RepID=UPI00119B5B01|nr:MULTISPECIES: AAA family ATPase [Flavobacteriaceae]TVZ51235.1 putative ATP-dependent endonuclease of OLD family [Dokdonia sp. Hel_I_53]WSP34659.1 AAA family ATPase [Croceibacter atlanticus]
MYLKNLKLWNFRKFGSTGAFDLLKPDLDLIFSKGVNVLIGQNDSGKTAIIDAIKLVLKTHSYEWLKVINDDFYMESNRLRIELIFDDLDPEEAKHFTEWLGWTEENGGQPKSYLRLIYDVTRNLVDNKIAPTDVKAGVDPIGYQLTAEARELLKTTYLKPLRNAQAELVPRKNSRLTQILQEHEAFKGRNTDHLLVGLFNEFNTSVEKYFLGVANNGVPLPPDEQKGNELKVEIDGYIKAFYNKSKESVFGVKGNNLKNILEKLELSIKDEINPGLGTMNRLFMASELLHLKKKDWTGIRLGLIEELEAHLHPQAQMQIIEALQKEKEIQLILSTHSPNLGSKIKLENLIVCCDNYAFPMGKNFTELADNDYKFLERFLDTTKANLFFAKGIIMVEGWSEEILLPAIAQRLKEQDVIQRNLTEAGVSIVNVASTAFQRYSRIYLRKNESLKKMTIPVAIITDVDICAYEKTTLPNGAGGFDNIYNQKNEQVVSADSILRTTQLETKYDRDNIKSFIAKDWTLEYALFKSTSLNVSFKEALLEIHPQMDSDHLQMELGKKLINKTLNKTELAYNLANKIEQNPTLVIDENDAGIKYLIGALKYVCND